MKQDQGQQSRRGLLRAGLAVIAGGSVAGVAMTTQAMATSRTTPRRFAQADKIAQAVVQYQLTPKDGAQCSGCVNFDPPNACKIVAGTIVPTGWCVAYAPKTG